MLSILLLGPPQILRDGEMVKVTRRKSRALIYYLAAHDHPLTREHILAFFWPDHERASAQQILRTTLHSLRKTLGQALLISEDQLGLAPEIDVDVREFEAKLASSGLDLARLEEAIRLYRDEFLVDFNLPDTLAFENWITVERERYRRLAMRGFTALARLQEANQDYRGALETLDRALNFDPLQEDLQRDALRYHYLSGDRPGSIRRYDQLRKLLDEELGVPPMAETRDLYQAILTEQLHEASPSILAAPPARARAKRDIESKQLLPFTGRGLELQAIQDQVSLHKLVLIEGEPGIGKSRLAEEFIRIFDGIPLSGAGRELEQNLPYQPVLEALRSLLARPDWPALRATIRSSLPSVWQVEVSRLLPELTGTPANPPPFPHATDEPRLWEGLHQFLAVLARQHPILLFLDDLHWADSSTLGMLDYLVRQKASQPVYFLAAARPALLRSPFASFLQTLLRRERVVRIPLSRLNETEVKEFSRRISSHQADRLSDWLMRNSEGNPYVLVELIRFAREQGILKPDGNLDEKILSDTPTVPQTIYALIQARLARLSEPARRILDAAVAVGRSFEFDVVARAAALSENAALDALDELRQAGLVSPQDGMRYTFDHTLTMEVAFREVGEPRHRLLHRRVAEAMESLYPKDRLEASAGLVASHYAEGNDPIRAASHALAAGREAMRVAGWKEAVAFYEMALKGANANQLGEIYTALGEVYFLAGDNRHAVEAFQKAVSLAEQRQGITAVETAKLALATALLSQARFDEVIELAKQVRRSADRERMTRAEVLWGTALSLEGADLAGAAEHLQNAASLQQDEGNLLSLSQIQFELGSIAAQQGDLCQAVSLYREALETAQKAPLEISASPQILAYNNLAYHLLLLEDPSAQDYADAGMALAREKGALGLQPFLLSTLGEIALARGDLDTAEEYFTEGLALAERISIPERVAGLTANLGLVALARGQADLAIHRLSMALVQADALGTYHLAAQIRLWLAPLLPPVEAYARLAEARAIAENSGRLRLLEDIARLEKDLLVR